MANKTVVESEFNLEATYPSNHVMRGTTVSDGHGIMRVLAVGDATEFGRVAEKSSEKSEEPTPLDKQLDSLAKFIGVADFVTTDNMGGGNVPNVMGIKRGPVESPAATQAPAELVKDPKVGTDVHKLTKVVIITRRNSMTLCR